MDSSYITTRKRRPAATISSVGQRGNEEHAAFPILKVNIKRFHAVAHWSWNANDDVCGICQNAFEGTAPGIRYPGEDCPVVWGQCKHAFHLQCVSTWLQQPSSKNSCPICRQGWEFGQNPVNSNAPPAPAAPGGQQV